MSNTLDWVGDGDDLAAVERLEQTFEISFSKEELTALTDVGSLHDLILQKISHINDKGKCASAMAFYRLRAALKSWRNDIAILPSTAMNVFTASSPKYLFRSLERQTGLRLGYPPHSWIGILGGLLVVTPIVALLPGLAWGAWVQPLPSDTDIVMTGMFFAGLLLLWLDPRRLPEM